MAGSSGARVSADGQAGGQPGTVARVAAWPAHDSGIVCGARCRMAVRFTARKEQNGRKVPFSHPQNNTQAFVLLGQALRGRSRDGTDTSGFLVLPGPSGIPSGSWGPTGSEPGPWLLQREGQTAQGRGEGPLCG